MSITSIFERKGRGELEVLGRVAIKLFYPGPSEDEFL